MGIQIGFTKNIGTNLRPFYRIRTCEQMDIGEKLGAEAAGLVKTEVLGAWTCLTGSRPIFIQARPMRPHTSQGRLFAP